MVPELHRRKSGFISECPAELLLRLKARGLAYFLHRPAGVFKKDLGIVNPYIQKIIVRRKTCVLFEILAEPSIGNLKSVRNLIQVNLPRKLAFQNGL